jgi:hypothetical protein
MEQPWIGLWTLKVMLPPLTWATLEFSVVQALACNERTLSTIWSTPLRIGGAKVIAPVNFRQVMLPVATVSLLGAAAAGGALRTNGVQNDAKIAADGTMGHLVL